MTGLSGLLPVPAPVQSHTWRGSGVPAGTSVRFGLLVLAVLAASSYLFQLLYLVPGANNARYSAGLDRCQDLFGSLMSPTPHTSEQLVRATRQRLECVTPQFHEMAAWAGWGIVLLFAVAVVLYLLHPWWITRRHQLAPLRADAYPDLFTELDDLRRSMNVTGYVAWWMKRSGDEITGKAFGLPWRRQVFLTNALVLSCTPGDRNFQLSRATIAHELAHLKNQDVDKTYFATSLYWAYLMVAVAPFLFWLASPTFLAVALHQGHLRIAVAAGVGRVHAPDLVAPPGDPEDP